MKTKFFLVQKIVLIILIIGGALIILLQVQSVFSFAHLHIDWVCESGEKLIQINTPDSIVNKFMNECSSTKGKINEIGITVIKNSFISSIFCGIMIITCAVQFILITLQNRKQSKIPGTGNP